MKRKLSEVQGAVMDELRHGSQTVDELKVATGRRVTWTTLCALRALGVVNIGDGRKWFLTGAAAPGSEGATHG